MKHFLSEKEESAVKRFLADETMMEAVRKILLSGVYEDGILVPNTPADPLKNFILGAFTTQTSSLLSYEEKGRKLDTIINAISLVESGFKQLERFKQIEVETKETINKAR